MFQQLFSQFARCFFHVPILILFCIPNQFSHADQIGPTGISIKKIDGRHWLVDSLNQPFFAHGITHASNHRQRYDFTAFSIACKKLGFNAYGYGCPEQLRGDLPYVESWNHLVPISTYRDEKSFHFVDIFDPAEQARLDAGVKANCEKSRQHPKKIIGYCWTDLAAWPLSNSTGKDWVTFIRSLPEGTSGRKAYQDFLKTWTPDTNLSKDQAFLRLIAREYFRVVGTANRKYDPDHLIFGDRFSFQTFDPDIVKEMLPYVDAIAIQPYFMELFPKKKLDEIYALTGKPILLCDFAIRFQDGEKNISAWKLAEDSVAAGKAYIEYLKAAFQTTYILGVFWCNPIDTPKGFGQQGVKQGFFADGLASRPGLHDAVREINNYLEKNTPTRDGRRK